MYYKLTDQEMRTYNDFQWELDKWYEIPIADQGDTLCSKSWFHCYSNPYLAVILNPIHANIENPRLFEIEVDGESLEDNQLKFGFTRMKLVKEIELPEISIEQKVEFAIRSALVVYDNEDFVEWAKNWLSGKDRSAESAAYASYYAADAANTAANAAAYAANAAAHAAHAAAHAAHAANAAAHAAAYAAHAANAAANAAKYNNKLNLIDIANEVFEGK